MLKAGWTCSKCSRQLRSIPYSHLRRPFSWTTRTQVEIRPKLLARARTISEQHASLSQQLEQSYDVQLAKRVGELSKTASLYKELEKLKDSLEELNSILHNESDAELRELAEYDLSSTREAIESHSTTLTSSLVPQHPFAHLSCLLEVRPGAGGSEAALFAGDLFRMYRSFCVNNRLSHTVLKYDDVDGVSDPNGSDAPLQEAILEISSEGAYGMLRGESGVHRVQRVPATETKGRVHTSAASILVLPSFPENANDGEDDVNNPESDFYLEPKDVRQEVMRARGAGGQHVNKTESAVRLTYLPTGTVVSMQDSRSQVANREKAYRLLRSRIALQRREAREAEMVQMRRSVVGVAKVGRGDKIRTYNWGQQRITDHRSGFTTHGLNDALQGGSSLVQVMESVKRWYLEQDLEALEASDNHNQS